MEILPETRWNVGEEILLKAFVLEDSPERQKHFKWWRLQGHEVTIVNNVGEAIAVLEEQEFDIAFLDHDLGERVYVDSFDKEETGYLVALWLAEHEDRRPEVIVLHSLNPAGRENMKAVLPDAHIIPFVWIYPLDGFLKR